MKHLLYTLLAVCLFWGVKICDKKQWNENVFSYPQMKSFRGFCALIIILHHCSQRTCAPWLPQYRIVHGLDGFVYAGYLCVAVFFFCSGYGLYARSRRKEDFFVGYHKRIIQVLIPAVVMWLTFFMIEKGKGMRIEEPIWINTFDYIWYVPAMICQYLLFYLSFHLIHNERVGMATLSVGNSIYFILCLLFSPGTWWYNTPYLFTVGIITARHRDRIVSFFKKGYFFWVLLSLAVAIIGFMVAGYYYQVADILGLSYQRSVHDIVELMGQMISALSFVVFVMLVGMKIRIGNKVLLFLGGFTLEIYLVHPLFVQLLGFAFIQDRVRPLYHIRNPFLYAAVVMVLSIPIAYLLHRLTAKITGRRTGYDKLPSQKNK